MRLPTKSNKGFTLIEIVTVIVVLGILGAFSLTFIDNAIKTYMIASKQRMLYQEGTYILERITREVRDSVSYGVDPFPYSFFKRIHVTPNPPYIDDNPYIRYALSGSNLQRYSRIFLGDRTNQLFGRNVTSYTMTRNPNPLTPNIDTFTFTITLAKDGEIVTLSATICPKNYCSAGYLTGLFGALCTPDYAGRNFNGDYEDVIQ
jgi:prepilin-type N-terminal cleavage/methylation domain-containing protein